MHSAAAMLQAVAAGQSCERVATTHGVVKSTVSQRVRNLAFELQRIVGVVGIDEEECPTARLIREHRDGYLEALGHYVPAAALFQTTDTLSEDRLHACLVKVRQRSRSPLRDEALLRLLFSTAAKPLEIARLQVGDYLNAHGDTHASTCAHPSDASAPHSHSLSLACPRTRQAIDTYLVERIERGWGTHTSPTYRGLDPASPLFLSRTGQPMRLTALAGGRYLLCKEIHGIYRRLFAYGGLPGFHTSEARRMAATQMRANGATRREIGAALGLQSLAVHKLLHRAPSPCRCANDPERYHAPFEAQVPEVLMPP